MADAVSTPAEGGTVNQAPAGAAPVPSGEAGQPAQAPATSNPTAPVGGGCAPKPDNSAAAGTNPPAGEQAKSEDDDPGHLLSDAVQDEPADSGVLGAPENGYEFKPAEGTNVHLDEASYKQFAEVAKELNLSQEAAQKIVDKMEPMLASRVKTLRTEWAKASRQDPEFGGANFATNIKAINRAYVATTTPKLREVLAASGLDNHPEVLRHFYGLSKTLGDGRFITSSGAKERADGSDPRNFYKGMNL